MRREGGEGEGGGMENFLVAGGVELEEDEEGVNERGRQGEGGREESKEGWKDRGLYGP